MTVIHHSSQRGINIQHAVACLKYFMIFPTGTLPCCSISNDRSKKEGKKSDEKIYVGIVPKVSFAEGTWISSWVNGVRLM